MSGHKLTRFNTLASLVSSVLISGKSTLSHLALGNADCKQHASKIKQFKRWLTNENVDLEGYYLPYVTPLLEILSQSGELVFSIDGSVVGKGCMCLMFSVIYNNKAIPVVWRVYKAKKGHLSEESHREILADLSNVVPCDCRVIIVGDGEFDGCNWQADIVRLGWDYVLKTAKNRRMIAGNDHFKIGDIKTVSGQETYHEQVAFTHKKWQTNLLIWHGKGHQAPVYLLTNLDFSPEIQRFYKKRWKI